ncbi:MAG: hypothetical protein NTU80_01400 [Verrucomicrobia bacterium]|nr:hypothetical protein [Verrucomicrobiota bacterium]
MMLLAARHLEAVLPALALLAPHDAELRRAAAGSRTFAVALTVRGAAAPRRLAFAAEGGITTASAAQTGDLRLWFPTAGQFLRVVNQQPALLLPLGGWGSLGQVGRFAAAGRRLDRLLRDPRENPALFAYGNLAVGLAGVAVWLRLHPAGAERRARLGDGVATFACTALPAPLWLDLRTLTSGVGAAPRPPMVELTFADLPTLLAELEHRLDALAALGGGELRIRGHLPVAEGLGLVLNEVSRLLNPAPRPGAERHSQANALPRQAP